MAIRDLSRELFGSHAVSFGVTDDDASDDATASLRAHGHHPHQHSITNADDANTLIEGDPITDAMFADRDRVH